MVWSTCILNDAGKYVNIVSSRDLFKFYGSSKQSTIWPMCTPLCCNIENKMQVAELSMVYRRRQDAFAWRMVSWRRSIINSSTYKKHEVTLVLAYCDKRRK